MQLGLAVLVALVLVVRAVAVVGLVDMALRVFRHKVVPGQAHKVRPGVRVAERLAVAHVQP
jgi:hypothetical protein